LTILPNVMVASDSCIESLSSGISGKSYCASINTNPTQ